MIYLRPFLECHLWRSSYCYTMQKQMSERISRVPHSPPLYPLMFYGSCVTNLWSYPVDWALLSQSAIEIERDKNVMNDGKNHTRTNVFPFAYFLHMYMHSFFSISFLFNDIYIYNVWTRSCGGKYVCVTHDIMLWLTVFGKSKNILNGIYIYIYIWMQNQNVTI